MGKPIDLTGTRVNKLTVIRRHEENTRYGSYKWVCRCECGKEAIVAAGNLRSGHAVSCGCVRKPHSGFGTRIYGIWKGMKERCLNPKSESFIHYGGRGIKVCEEWMEFVPFRDWALANGYSDDLQIDRKAVNGNYEPGNCRFVTGTVNNQNKRTTKLNDEKVRGIRKLLNEGKKQKEIGAIYGVPQNTISQIKNGKLWGSIQ